MALGELIPCGGGDPVPLLKSRLLIGRSGDLCDVVLAFPNVSVRHCQLELTNGYWMVRDLNSRNGTKVNGVRCDTRWLQPGDELSIGKHAFQIQYEPSGDAPPPQEEEDPLEQGLLEKAGLMRRKAAPRAQSAKPVDEVKPDRFSKEEDDAARWLSDDKT